MSRAALAPGPKGHIIFGNLLEFGADILGFFERCTQEHGDVVRFRLAHRTAFLLSNPDHIEQVLVTNNKNFVKHSFTWRHVRAMFGRGLLTNEGAPWLHQRRRFAMMEAVLLLATVVSRFHLSLAPHRPVTPFPSMTLRPEHGVWMTVDRRPHASPEAAHHNGEIHCASPSI